MKLLTEEVIEKFLIPYINNKWTYMQQEIKVKRLPFIIEEAVLNTALTGSIFRYINDNSKYNSTLVSEGKVQRSGGISGRCDIIWYSDDESVHYIELKGVFYGYGNNETTISEAYNYLDKAIEQVNSICSKEMLTYDGKQTENEYLFGYFPVRRFGFVGGIILSEVTNNETNYDIYCKLLDNNNRLLVNKVRPTIKKHRFDGKPLNISYYQRNGKMVNKMTDGYFLLCSEFEI